MDKKRGKKLELKPMHRTSLGGKLHSGNVVIASATPAQFRSVVQQLTGKESSVGTEQQLPQPDTGSGGHEHHRMVITGARLSANHLAELHQLISWEDLPKEETNVKSDQMLELRRDDDLSTDDFICISAAEWHNFVDSLP